MTEADALDRLPHNGVARYVWRTAYRADAPWKEIERPARITAHRVSVGPLYRFDRVTGRDVTAGSHSYVYRLLAYRIGDGEWIEVKP